MPITDTPTPYDFELEDEFEAIAASLAGPLATATEPDGEDDEPDDDGEDGTDLPDTAPDPYEAPSPT